MDELSLAVDDLKAAEEKDKMSSLLVFGAIGAGLVALLMAFKSKES